MIKRKAKHPVYKKLRPFIKGTAAALIVLALTSLLMSLCICVAGLSEDSSDLPAVISLCISLLAGGMVTGSVKGENGFFWGGVEGLLLFLIILTTAIITGNTSNDQLVLKLLCCIISGTVGGIIGVNLPIER